MAFKMICLWSAWSPQVQSRVIRDVLSMQRLARLNQAELVVACDELARKNVSACGVQTTEDFTSPDVCMVYLLNGSEIPSEVQDRMPLDIEPLVVSLHGDSVPNGNLVVDEDPYAGVEFFQNTRRINETMPLDKRPPHVQHPDYVYSPYL